jgi:hypothetical protein
MIAATCSTRDALATMPIDHSGSQVTSHELMI